MEKKIPPHCKEVAKNLADFIVKNWHHCPVSEDEPVPECEGWGSDLCKRCIKKHSDKLG